MAHHGSKIGLMRDDIPTDLAERHRADTNGAEVVYMKQGSFTLAILLNREGNPVSFGVAKRNVMDPENPSIGCRIAVSRALRNLKPLLSLAKESK